MIKNRKNKSNFYLLNNITPLLSYDILQTNSQIKKTRNKNFFKNNASILLYSRFNAINPEIMSQEDNFKKDNNVNS